MVTIYLQQSIFQKYQTASFDVQMLRLGGNIGTRKNIVEGIRQTLREAAGLQGRLKALQK